MSFQRLCRYACVLVSVLLCACGAERKEGEQKLDSALDRALSALHLDRTAMSLPKIGSYKVAERGRLPIVDAVLNDPMRMIGLSADLAATEVDPATSLYLARLLGGVGLKDTAPAEQAATTPDAQAVWAALNQKVSGSRSTTPPQLVGDAPLARALRNLLFAAAQVQMIYDAAGGKPSPSELAAIQKHLLNAVRKPEPKPGDERWLMPFAYHDIGARADVSALTGGLLRLVAAVQTALPDLRAATRTSPTAPIAWETPLGKVGVWGMGNDRHSGGYLLLIDLGGDDRYDDVGRPPGKSGVSVVIDLSGNDVVRWHDNPGPGAGVLGIDLWADMQGNDQYLGGNMGAGAALLGAGMLWDAQGDDVYRGGSMVQGVGQYGVGVLLDEQGNDSYEAGVAGQGFGGPGGFGFLVDLAGNESYSCGRVAPDQAEDRVARHAGVHYLSMCQGYAFGLRPQASGGVGVLLDRSGDDLYKADIFAQGGGYWFGLGMLVDRQGNDQYKAFEHCQGSGLHLGAGVLADLGGDDTYAGYEHCQGVGIDRAAGVLYEVAGNDRYQAEHQSQGSGIKPYGVGLMIDMQGDDQYVATAQSQGYSALSLEFPAEQWPLGVLLDLGGANEFQQPDMKKPNGDGRISSRGGIAYDH